jgi:hypothetical protein
VPRLDEKQLGGESQLVGDGQQPGVLSAEEGVEVMAQGLEEQEALAPVPAPGVEQEALARRGEAVQEAPEQGSEEADALVREQEQVQVGLQLENSRKPPKRPHLELKLKRQ